MQAGLPAISQEVLIVHPTNITKPLEGGDIRFSLDLLRKYKEQGVSVGLLGTGTTRVTVSDDGTVAVNCAKEYVWYRYLLGLGRVLLRLRTPADTVLQTTQPLFMFPLLFLRPGNPKIVGVGAVPLEYVRLKFPFLLPFVTHLYRVVERIMVSQCECIVFFSSNLMNMFRDRYPRAITKFHIIPVGVDLTRFRRCKPSAEILSIASLGPIVLFVGRIERVKDLSFLLTMFSTICTKRPNVQFVIVGRGSDETRIRSAVAKNGIPNVNFIGEIAPDRMPEVYSGARALVLASISEGSPAVVREAMACGVPVVSTKVGDVATTVEVGAGLIVDKVPERFAEAVLDVLEWPQSTAISKCHEVAGKYSVDRIVERYVELVRRLQTDRLRGMHSTGPLGGGTDNG